MYKLDPKKNVSIGDVMTFSELCDLFNKKPTTNRTTQMKAINVWLDVEKVDKTHYKITGIRPPKVVTEKRPKGRPRLSEEERTRRVAIKKANRRPVGRPKMTPEEKEEARKKREARKPVESKRPVGRPRLPEEEKIRRKNEAMLKRKKYRTAICEIKNEKTYVYNIRSKSIYTLPARDVILKLLMENNGRISGTRKAIMEYIGMVNSDFANYRSGDYKNSPDVINIPSIANIYYYTESILSVILSQSIFNSLSTRHQLFTINNVYFYTRNGVTFSEANEFETDTINKYMKEVLNKYCIPNEANLFYMSNKLNVKLARQEFNELIDNYFGWRYSIRGVNLTINKDVAIDLGDEILKQDMNLSKIKLNQVCIDRIKNKMYQHGSKFIGYDPNTVIKFGTDNTSMKQEYEVHCKNVDVFIDKYIRLDPV